MKYSVNTILKKANKFEYLAAHPATLLFFGLPALSKYIKEKFIDTARGITESVTNLEQRFSTLDESMMSTWDFLKDEGHKKYESTVRPKLIKLVNNAKNLSKVFKAISDPSATAQTLHDELLKIANTSVTHEQLFEDFSKLDKLLYSVQSEASAVRSELEDTKGWLVSTVIESAEDMGFTFGVRNYVRTLQDAIDRLNTEINVSQSQIDQIKKKLEEEVASKSKNDLVTTDKSTILTDRSKTPSQSFDFEFEEESIEDQEDTSVKDSKLESEAPTEQGTLGSNLSW